jgi:transposase-like protein
MSEAASKANQFKSRTLTQQQWLEHFKRCESSGLTVAAYVRSQGLKPSTFYRWRSRLLQEQVDQAADMKSTASLKADVPPAPEPVFHRVECAPEPLPESAETVALRFRLPNGIDCELGGLSLGNCTGFLDALARLRP